MRYEYRQVKYRASESRFDGSLNKMAAEGWKVESIDRINSVDLAENVFLVTYSRFVQQMLKHDVCRGKDLGRVLAANQQVGNRLVTMTGWASNVHDDPGEDFKYTLVWEITRPGERQTRTRLTRQGNLT